METVTEKLPDPAQAQTSSRLSISELPRRAACVESSYFSIFRSRTGIRAVDCCSRGALPPAGLRRVEQPFEHSRNSDRHAARLLSGNAYMVLGEPIVEPSCFQPKFQSNHGVSPLRRSVSLAVLATISALATVASISPAPAEAIQDRYCLQGRIWGYPGNCQFSSYAQCMASASGTNAYCGINPQYAFARQPRGAHRHRY
jgi:hypothetical protein